MNLAVWCCEDRRAPFVEVFRRSAAAQGWDLRLFAPAATPPADFRRLAAAYRHLSPNSAGFELAVFRRYFEIRDRMAAEGAPPATRFIMADSDLLLLGPPSALPEALLAGDIAGSLGVTGGVTETDVSPHFSRWTRAAMADFCDFLVATYEAGADDLAAIHARRTAAREAHVSISDMTLLRLWIAARGLAFTDTNRVIDGRYIDHNITMASCGNARFRMALGRKALAFDGGGISLTSIDGAPVRPLLLHFVGRAKTLLPAVAARRRGELALRSLGWAAARRVRGWLA